MTERKLYDAVIIGGGASGLMSAITAKTKNKNIKIAIIEKNDKTGRKLLSTGNGRCNLTNNNICSEKYKGTFAYQTKEIFEKYTAEYMLNIFRTLGLLTYADSDGRYYPLSKHASAVSDVLRLACERLGADIYCSENIKSIKKQNGSFITVTESGEYNSQKLVISCGSKAAPKLGGNASGIDYLKNFGHTAYPFSPALCPVKVKSDIIKPLKGIRSLCCARLIKDGKIIKSEKGEVQFTENALSGICIFNLSVYCKKGDIIELDLLNEYSYSEIYNILYKQKNLFAKHTVDNLFTGIFHKRLGQAILKSTGITDFSLNCLELNNKEIKSLCRAVKFFDFEVIENAGFDQAQCALGGIKGNEINRHTMESLKTKGLYITGEAIDICGECGGYNLHFAFASGHLAGENL